MIVLLNILWNLKAERGENIICIELCFILNYKLMFFTEPFRTEENRSKKSFVVSWWRQKISVFSFKMKKWLHYKRSNQYNHLTSYLRNDTNYTKKTRGYIVGLKIIKILVELDKINYNVIEILSFVWHCVGLFIFKL